MTQAEKIEAVSIDQSGGWIGAGIRTSGIITATAVGGMGFVSVATASVLLVDSASAIFFLSIGVGGGVAWRVGRRWWWKLLVVGITAALSHGRVIAIRYAANEEAWRLAEAGQREFPVSDGGANTFAALFGWVPGLFLAALVVAVLRVAVRPRSRREALRGAASD